MSDQSQKGRSLEHHTFPELLDIWIGFHEAEEKSESTVETYRWTVGQFVNFLEAESVSPDTISVADTTAYMGEVRKRPGRKKPQNGDKPQISKWGRYALAKDARNFLNWLHANRYLEFPVKVPVPKAPKQKRPHLETQAKIDAFREATQFGRNRMRDEALVLLMLESGLRNFEVRAVNWGHTWKPKTNIPIAKVFVPKGKGRKERTVSINSEAWTYLRLLKSDVEVTYGLEFVADDQPVFLLERGTRMTEDGMTELFKRLSGRAGFHVTPHMLRHTYGRTMVKRGLPLPVLQFFMGHSNIKTTMIYAELDEDDGLDDIFLAAIQNGA